MENQLSLEIYNSSDSLLAESHGNEYANLVYKSSYEEGDYIIFKTNTPGAFYVIQLDDALGANFVYITKNTFRFVVPFNDRKLAYSPKAFSGSIHLLCVRPATSEEISSYKNLAYNIYDEHGDTGCYPHATANIETRNEPVFFARSVIDGVRENSSHGIWPYCSWGIDRLPTAEITVHFGRKITTDKIILVIRADFPHDSWWDEATLDFSDGSSLCVPLQKTAAPQSITFPAKDTEWIKLCRLIKNQEDPSPFPALSQFEVYGTEAGL